ncbi:MAG TPA: hypothetical protein VIT20_09605 [Propionibacteriaceae bacterium]
MQIAHQLLVLVDLIGFAALFGGVLVQLRDREPEVSAAMLHGAWIQLVAGAALFVLDEAAPGQTSTTPLVFRAVITVFVVVLVVANRKYASIPRGLWLLIGVLALANTGIAVLWQ